MYLLSTSNQEEAQMRIRLSEKEILISPVQTAKVLQTVLKREERNDQLKEHFWVFGLDSRNRIKYLELVSLGSLNSNLVHPREVFRLAIQKSICQIILAHNHPSGEVDPSEDDLKINKRLVEAGKIIGIEILDHIIIAENYRYMSFKEKGLMK